MIMKRKIPIIDMTAVVSIIGLIYSSRRKVGRSNSTTRIDI